MMAEKSWPDWQPGSSSAAGGQDGRREDQYEGRRLHDYVEEQIRAAQERGLFDHLAGMGKPLKLTTNPYAGEKELSYHLLQSNGFAPREVALAAEIREELAAARRNLLRLQQRRARLSARRVPPLPSEKRAFNAALAHAVQAYETTLRELNRQILTLSLIAPPAMHIAMLDVERLVEDFRRSCPPLQ